MVAAPKPTRRRFIAILLGGSALTWVASVLYPVLRYLMPKEETEAQVSSAKVAMLAEFPPNCGKVVKFGSKPVIVIRKPDGTFKAFNGKCTHLDCIVQYRPDYQRIWCACHNGQYDLNGLNVAGPPPRPLDPLEVHIVGDEIFVSRQA